MRQVDRLTADMTRVREQICAFGRRQPACRALQAAHYGVGPLTAVVIWAEMGDTRRFHSSDDAVRHAGLDVTVYSSDGRRSAGHLARQGPPMLRWALYEAAVYAGRPSSPDHAYFQQVKPASAASWRCCRWPANSPAAATTPCATSTTRSSPPPPDRSTARRPTESRDRAASHARPDEPAVSSRQPCCCRPRAGQPTKNERPRPSRHPDRHLVAGPGLRAEHPDKQGPPDAPREHPRPGPTPHEERSCTRT